MAANKFMADGWWVLLASAGVLGAAAYADRGGYAGLGGMFGSGDDADDMDAGNWDDGSWNDEGSMARSARTGRFTRGR